MKKPALILYILLLAVIALMMFHKPGPVPGNPRIGGTFTLTDTRGHTVKNTDFLGKPMIVYMGYTNCPDICPATLLTISTALKSLGPDATRVTPVFITLDPARDTPAVLARYLAAFDPRIIGLTGTKPAVDQTVREYRAYYKKQQPKAANDYLVDHSGYIYVMDKKGMFVNILHPDAKPDDVVNLVKEALAK